jgi:hypothetical protein
MAAELAVPLAVAPPARHALAAGRPGLRRPSCQFELNPFVVHPDR